MPNLTSIVTALSLDCTANLVAAGVKPFSGWPKTIIGASNATPIVLTLSEDHDLVLPVHVVVSGVTGNTNANSTDLSIAPFGAWIASPNGSPNELTLTSLSGDGNSTISSSGNGTYSGGGTVATALSDGRIVLGIQHRSESSSPPRIVFVPRSTHLVVGQIRYGGPRPLGGQVGGKAQTTEMVHQRFGPMIGEDNVRFEVTCWGQASPPDPYEDFNVAQVLYQQVIRTCMWQIQGTFGVSDGEWIDQYEDAKNKLDIAGHKMCFGLIVDTPIVDYLFGHTTIQQITATTSIITPPNTSGETAWTGPVT